VELSGEWFKIIHAEPSRQGVAVSRAHVAQIDPDDAELAATLRDIYAEQKLPKSPVLGCIPRQMVTVRMLDLPSTDPDEIGDMVDLQSGAQTPYSREEVVFDYRILGVAQGGYAKVLLAIVQRSVLRERHLVFEEAGIDVDRMTVSPEGLLGWFGASSLSSSGGVMVIDVDAASADCSVFADGCLVFTRRIQMGADGLRDGGEAALRQFAGEVRRSLEVCQSDVQGVSAQHVVLTGGSPAVEGLADALGADLGLRVEQVSNSNCVTREPRGKPLADIAAKGVSLTSVLGVAAGQQNLVFGFVPDSVRFRRRLLGRARRTARFAMLLMVLFVSLSCCASVSYYLQWEHLSSLREETSSKTDAANWVLMMRGRINKILGRTSSEGTVIRMLDRLHAATPDGIAYDHVETDLLKAQATLEGTGKSIPEIQNLLKNLNGTDVFEDAKEDGATTLDPTSKRYRFRVVCKLKGKDE